jgi:hypothetical protein
MEKSDIKSETMVEQVKKMVDNLEETYKAQKAKEIENLYNDIIKAIANQPNPHIANILTAIKLVEHNFIAQKLNEISQNSVPLQASGTAQ